MDLKLAMSKLFYRVLVFIISGAGVLTLLWAAGRALIDVAEWLKTARTSGYSNASLLYDLGIVNQQTGWLGLQKIIDYLLAWPAWTGLLTVGIIIFTIGSPAIAKLEEIKHVELQKKWKKENPDL